MLSIRMGALHNTECSRSPVSLYELLTFWSWGIRYSRESIAMGKITHDRMNIPVQSPSVITPCFAHYCYRDNCPRVSLWISHLVPELGWGWCCMCMGGVLGGGFRSTKESQNYFLSKIRLFFYGLWVKSACPPPIFVNKILWNTATSFIYCLWLLSFRNGQVTELYQRPCDPQCPKYWQHDPWREFVTPGLDDLGRKRTIFIKTNLLYFFPWLKN